MIGIKNNIKTGITTLLLITCLTLSVGNPVYAHHRTQSHKHNVVTHCKTRKNSKHHSTKKHHNKKHHNKNHH